MPAALLFAAAAIVAAAEPIQLHPQGRPLPFDHQGPFVTTSDGGVLGVGRSHSYVSYDEGKTWENDQLTIVCFGTSTTARRNGVASVYADLLRNELPDHGLPARVVNQGVPGNHTNDAVKRFESDVRAYRPDIVILLFGTNDSAVDVWRGATEPRVPRETFRKNLTAMVRKLKADRAKPILVTPQVMSWTAKLKDLYAGPPHHERSPYDAADPLGFNATLVEYVQAIREVASREGVDLVDLHRQFMEYGATEGRQVDDLLLDGMHPNDKGHRMIADALLPIIIAHASKR